MLKQSILMIPKFLLNFQTIWMMSVKALKIIIQIRNAKY